MNSSTSKLWTGQFAIIIFMTFLFFLCLQMLTGGFPIFVTGFSQSPALGGIMTTAFMLAAIITRPIIGIIMHKLNMKRLLSVVLLCVLACIIASYNQQAMPLLILLRILEGIGFGISTTLLATLATNLIPQGRLGEGIGYFGMATSLGTTLGPMFALSILNSSSFNILLVVTMILSALTFICGLFIKNNKSVQPGPDLKGSLISYAFDKKAFLPCFLVMLFYVTFSGIVNFINGFGEEIHIGAKVSIFFLINAVIMVVIRPFSGKIYDRMGHKFLIYPAAVCGFIGLILMAMGKSFTTLIIAAVLYGIAYGVMQPSFQAWAVSRVSADKKGTANAMSLSFMDLGMALGSATLGGVAGLTSYKAMYGISSLLIIALLLIYMTKHSKVRKIEKANREAA
ncbi:putative MFS family arabinose efflux permease [Scopulibacillus darangshiensis]|uniref:Putative MFS family arabinose efflux permease n=1 Tax=Scopulibacillus darangshiensis TaxID=442528 RepID=A0A4R2P5C8_9BACL|nr:MFS transporter [Scopulibacillus darangshiensis]TCP29983.1 putative MFS family arabinose efflux permease [Scopulibacillus darangshiensis]